MSVDPTPTEERERLTTAMREAMDALNPLLAGDVMHQPEVWAAWTALDKALAVQPHTVHHVGCGCSALASPAAAPAACPYIVTGDEGTSHCSLAESAPAAAPAEPTDRCDSCGGDVSVERCWHTHPARPAAAPEGGAS